MAVELVKRHYTGNLVKDGRGGLSYYVENMRPFPDCKSFPDDTLSDVLMKRNNPPPNRVTGVPLWASSDNIAQGVLSVIAASLIMTGISTLL